MTPLPAHDHDALRAQFPLLQQQLGGRALVYLDSAASAQKPQVVIDAIEDCYSHYYANIHRGLYRLSEQSTAAYEKARERVAEFLHAPSAREVIFTRGATEAINLVAQSFLAPRLPEQGGKVVLTQMEHHANIVPWQLAGAELRPVHISDAGEVDLDDYRCALSEPGVAMVALCHVSNALGTVNPAAEMVRMARERHLPVLLDGAQAVPHLAVDVAALDCDFYVFSGHKLYGPSGIGVLWGREDLLEAMPPYQGGGDMIDQVSFERTTWAPLPMKFEAGTPNIAGAIGLGVAIDWFNGLDASALHQHEHLLLEHATAALQMIDGLRILGTAPGKIAVISFVVEGAHPQDIGTLLDQFGVAVRTGHHCTQPLMQRFEVPATVRASFGLYNNHQDVDVLVDSLQKVLEMLR